MLALCDGGGGHGATVANIRQAMLLKPGERHEKAQDHRRALQGVDVQGTVEVAVV